MAGHRALFPEYHHPTMKFETVFRKSLFDPLRTYCFPNGTSRKRGRKDVDVQSIRTFGIDETEAHYGRTWDPAFDEKHRRGLGGHEQKGTDGKIYEDDFEPHELLPQVEFLASFLPPIPKRPLNIRPPEYQRFGKPRGRKKKISEIIELLLARSDKIGLPKDLAKERLEDAAANVERQFEALVPEVLEGPSSPFLQQIKHEKLVETQARLKGIVLNLQKIALRKKDPDEREKRNQLWWSAKLLEWMGAGIDDLGRPVFSSVEAFRDGIEHLIDKKHLAKGERFNPPKDGPHF